MSWERELGRTVLFAGVPPQMLGALGERAVRRRYRKGSVVFVRGERGDRCYTILSGAVKIGVYSDDGREIVLAVLGPGDVFGELSLFDTAPRSADATALEATEVLSLDAEAVGDAIRSDPDLGTALLRVLSDRLRTTNEALQDAAFFDVAGRVARRMADLAETHGRPVDEGVLIDVPLSQESLASMVGATRESVNKALAGLSRKGLVTRRGRRYVVSDAENLRARAR